MSGGSVMWAKTPDEDRDDADQDQPGELDESFAARRLRRWIKGMFGGQDTPPEDDKIDEQRPES